MNARTMLPPLTASQTINLPSDYVPQESDVLVGRGKGFNEHHGNIRFRQLVKSFLQPYAAATSKHQKSLILSAVVSRTRKCSAGPVHFIKRDPATQTWFEVGDFLAREMTSQTFRNILHKRYRSSNLSKKLRRVGSSQDSLNLNSSYSSLPSLQQEAPSAKNEEFNLGSLTRNGSARSVMDKEVFNSSSLSSYLIHKSKTMSGTQSTEKSSGNTTWRSDDLNVSSIILDRTLRHEDLLGNLERLDLRSQPIDTTPESKIGNELLFAGLERFCFSSPHLDFSSEDPFEPVPLPPS